MSVGLSMSVVGAQEAAARLLRVQSTSESAATRALLSAGTQAHDALKLMLSQPQRIDPFWGVMGAAGELGLAARSGLTRSAVVFPRAVYVGEAGVLYTFIAHPSEHVRQLEDGGPVPGVHWIPTAAAQTAGGVERKDIPGAFVWPTKRMKNFRNGTPKHSWLVMAAPKTGAARARAQRGNRRGQGPMPATPGSLIFLKMKKDGITTKGHHSFGTVRAEMEPVMAALGNEAAVQIVEAA